MTDVDPAVLETAQRRSYEAEAASEVAVEAASPEAHTQACELHREAAKWHRRAESRRRAEVHEIYARVHAQAAVKLDSDDVDDDLEEDPDGPGS